MRLLIIDDDLTLAQSLKLSLENERFLVDLAHDGEKGSFLARTNDYDLILLDLMLPKQDGLMTCREIRSDGLKVPILVLSAKTELPTKIELLNAGVDDYLTKPFAQDELMARIKAILRRPKSMLSEVLHVSDLMIDAKKHVVKRGDRKIYLTKKEFILLEYLMQHEGIVLSRSNIMEHVWDMNADPFSNTIETHILNLRKKIDRQSTAKLIHTVPGRGYKIEAE